MRRVVVTGLDAVSPLGSGAEIAWARLLAGQSGLRGLPGWAASLPAKVAGIVPDKDEVPEGGFDPDQVVPVKDQRKMDRFIQFALVAAAEAIAQARWAPTDARELERTATVIASGIGGFPAIVDSVRTTDQRGVRRLWPFTIPSFLANLAAGHVSIGHGYKGPIGTPVMACAAGVQAIGDAARLIRGGEADVAVCGGTEACIDLVSLGGFAAARALSTGFNETPHRASRPYDRDRDGFVMGEGAGILVIEERDHALARGATSIAEIIGYGTTADAHHMTAGPEDGEGARRAMQIALRQAQLVPADIQHLNAHAKSTPLGDVGELAAIKAVFGSGATITVSATKSVTGHLLGAAGGLEAIFTVLALRDQIAPPTLNLETLTRLPAGSTSSARRPGRRRWSTPYRMASDLAVSTRASSFAVQIKRAAKINLSSIDCLSFAADRNAECFAAGAQHLLPQLAIADGARDDNRAYQ
jgi:3-oxoacyl-[acyl-carrier-protein] synthase II